MQERTAQQKKGLSEDRREEEGMKHIFIVNPHAGGKDAAEPIREAIRTVSTPIDAQIYLTQCAQDATAAVRRFREKEEGHLRFYSCGGDGTLSEVATGLVGLPDVSLSCFAVGSCNDFVKYFGGEAMFHDLNTLVRGKTIKIDLLRVGDRYSINAVNFGFDSAVVKAAVKFRHVPIIGGARAYTAGIVKALLSDMKHRCRVIVDGEEIDPKGELLLSTFANGSHLGGGYRCAPRADMSDGLMEVCYVRPIGRMRFFGMVGAYRAGTHLDEERFADYLIYRQAKHVHLESEEEFDLTLDGELIPGKSFDIEVVPSALDFALPPHIYNRFAKEEAQENATV